MGKSQRKRTAKMKAKPASPRSGAHPAAATGWTGVDTPPRANLASADVRRRVENGIVASHEQPTTLARKAPVSVPEADSDLPAGIAQSILNAANDITNVRQDGPRYSDEDVTRLIEDHPDIALEGLTRLGRVMKMSDPPSDGVLRGSFDPLETKARVVGDMRAMHIDNPAPEQLRWAVGEGGSLRGGLPETTLREAVQVDIQAIYDRWMSTAGNDIYEMNLSPPWFNAILLYTNDAGNVWAMHMIGADMTAPEWTGAYRDEIAWQPQPPVEHTIDWDRVRWVYSVQVYVGGMGGRTEENHATWQKVRGPLMIWRFAVYENGEPADVHWTHLEPRVPMRRFNNALGAFAETINMCNCVNVNVAYPDRPMPRPQRRRFERMGVRFSEIHIKPARKSYRGKGEALADMEMPVHGVRGHYATYGGDSGNGLLFGKLSGRFWIPPHVRGTAAVGEVVQSYVTEAQ